MPSVLEIIRKRWSELLMLVVLSAGLVFVLMDLMNRVDVDNPEQGFNLSGGALFFLFSGITFLGVMVYMAMLGFWVSIYLHRTQPQDPIYLIRLGRAFFWRMIRFNLVFSLFQVSIYTILFAVYAGITNNRDTQPPQWFNNVSSLIILAILIKPYLLCQPLMIARNCMVGQSFGLLVHYRIKDMLKLISHFALWLTVGIILGLLLSYLEDPEGSRKIFYAALAVTCIVFSAGVNIISIHALRYVILSEAKRIQDRGKETGDIDTV